MLFASLFIFRDGFHNILIYNMFIILILFIARFNIILQKDKKELENELN